METKNCNKCNETKEVSNFPKWDKHSYKNICKVCENERRRSKVKIKYPVSVESKACSTCKVEKKAEEFDRHADNKTGLFSVCKTCRKVKTGEYYKKNAEQIKLKCKERYNNPNITVDKDLFIKKYNITEDAFKEIYKWCRNTIWKKERRNLNINKLIECAIVGKIKYPYMTFGGNNQNIRASLDRINPDLNYINTNIQVIPFWLNNAKGTMTIDQLNEFIKHYMSTMLYP